MNSTIVVIPIYKKVPDTNEFISFSNNIKILSKHTISILTFRGLNISYYLAILDNNNITYQIDYFDKKYFDGLLSYNKLLLSEMFYKNYESYDFILITQLDVYVFRDELEYWCNKNYDYIGAPWFDRFRTKHEDGKLKKVGNGGFSLRKIASFIDVFKYVEKNNKTISLFNFWNKYEFFECHKFSFRNIWKRMRGIENNLSFYLNSTTQEDVVWSLIVPEAIKTFKIAPIKEAIKFSFESDPIYLYKKNSKKLPFGCHAWHKNQYVEFWSNFIQINEQ